LIAKYSHKNFLNKCSFPNISFDWILKWNQHFWVKHFIWQKKTRAFKWCLIFLGKKGIEGFSAISRKLFLEERLRGKWVYLWILKLS
jgi:hypothetical protein